MRHAVVSTVGRPVDPAVARSYLSILSTLSLLILRLLIILLVVTVCGHP